MLKPSLYECSDVYILVKGTIAVDKTAAADLFKNCNIQYLTYLKIVLHSKIA